MWDNNIIRFDHQIEDIFDNPILRPEPLKDKIILGFIATIFIIRLFF